MFQWFSGWLHRDSVLICSWWWRSALLGLTCPAFAAPTILPVNEVASGVFVIPAVLADATPENRGHVVNSGFIVGRDGVVVIDSGANHRHGEAILATVARVTPKPVKLLINTHPHPQNVLGNSVFAERNIPILATAEAIAAMDQRCPGCLASLRESVGEEAMGGTRIRLPDTAVATAEVVEVAGLRLRLVHFGHGHTEGDLAVFDEASAALFSGDLVYNSQIPHLSESNTGGWIEALDRLSRLPIRILIPGRGPSGGADGIAPIGRYLSELRQRVVAAYQEGRSVDEAIALAELPEFAGWQGYAARHGRNVQHVYFEIERDDLGRWREGSR